MNRHDTEIMHGMGELGKSRSQKKRESAALQKMGEALAALGPGALAELELQDDLASAIRDLRVMKKHEARRRQLQLVGRYMRELDEAEQERIALFLDKLNKQCQVESDDLHRLEERREALMDEDGRETALAEIAAAHPEAELKKLRHLAETAAAERRGGKGVKAFRELFRYLKGL